MPPKICPICGAANQTCLGDAGSAPPVGLLIQDERKATVGDWKSDQRLHVNADRTKIVDENDPEAAFLLAVPGTIVPEADAKRLGLGPYEGKATGDPPDAAPGPVREPGYTNALAVRVTDAEEPGPLARSGVTETRRRDRAAANAPENDVTVEPGSTNQPPADADTKASAPDSSPTADADATAEENKAVAPPAKAGGDTEHKAVTAPARPSGGSTNTAKANGGSKAGK